MGASLLWLEDAPGGVVASLLGLYRERPLTHFYLVHDLVEHPEDTMVVLALRGGVLEGYAMAYRTSAGLYVHVWNTGPEALAQLLGRVGRPGSRLVVQLHGSSVGLAEELLDAVRAAGFRGARITYYLDMAVVEPAEFRGFSVEGARVRRLGPENAGDYAGLEASRGRELSVGEAARLLSSIECYGAYAEGVLGSIACVYLKTGRVWLIGNVYTRPRLRGRGLAKTVTSTVTGKALECGATPFLHVEESNTVAVHLYRGLGYRVVGRRPWILQP